MFGRFIIAHPNEAIANLFEAVPGSDLPPSANSNLCPTNAVAVVTSDGGRRLRTMRWGFIPAWYKVPMIAP